MDWVRRHYTEQSRAFGRPGITARHREIRRPGRGGNLWRMGTPEEYTWGTEVL
jgi:hypothetical protein